MAEQASNSGSDSKSEVVERAFKVRVRGLRLLLDNQEAVYGLGEAVQRHFRAQYSALVEVAVSREGEVAAPTATAPGATPAPAPGAPPEKVDFPKPVVTLELRFASRYMEDIKTGKVSASIKRATDERRAAVATLREALAKGGEALVTPIVVSKEQGETELHPCAFESAREALGKDITAEDAKRRGFADTAQLIDSMAAGEKTSVADALESTWLIITWKPYVPEETKGAKA